MNWDSTIPPRWLARLLALLGIIVAMALLAGVDSIESQLPAILRRRRPDKRYCRWWDFQRQRRRAKRVWDTPCSPVL